MDGVDDVITPVSVGSTLDWLDGWAITEGLAEGSNMGLVKGLWFILGRLNGIPDTEG